MLLPGGDCTAGRAQVKLFCFSFFFQVKYHGCLHTCYIYSMMMIIHTCRWSSYNVMLMSHLTCLFDCWQHFWHLASPPLCQQLLKVKTALSSFYAKICFLKYYHVLLFAVTASWEDVKFENILITNLLAIWGRCLLRH